MSRWPAAALSSAWILLAAWAVSPAYAGFVAPAEGPIPFRRDRLPVDADAMRDLSRQVFELTGGVGRRAALTPLDERELAKMLALSLALDPMNRASRRLLEQLSSGEAAEFHSSGGRAGEAGAALQKQLVWLTDSDAGEDANALAACLSDLLPGDKSEETGKWQGWIPDLAVYQAASARSAKPETLDPSTQPPPPAAPAAPKPTPLAEAQLWVPVRKTSHSKPPVIVPLHMSGSTGNPGKTPLLKLAGDKQGRVAENEPFIQAGLTPRLGAFPAGLDLALNFPENENYDFDLNGRSISGAAAALVDEALTGKAPAPTIVFAVVGNKGALELPPHFWSTLRNLPPKPAMRLIVPRAAAEYLTAIITLEQPDFFLAHETLLADNLDELCAMARNEGDVAEATARFAEIQKASTASPGKSVGGYLADPNTLARLEAVSAAMPNHASARLLTVQGSGNRPRYLPRPIVAQELRTALQPLEYVRDTAMDKLDPSKLDGVHEEVLRAMAGVARYTDSRDRDMQKEATAATDTLRSVARALKMNESRYSTDVAAKRKEAYQAATAAVKDIVAKLTIVAGDGADSRKAAPSAEE